jgi:hypothetical protein
MMSRPEAIQPRSTIRLRRWVTFSPSSLIGRGVCERNELDGAGGRSEGEMMDVVFPSDLIFGPVPEPALRFITCGGSFDDAARSYRANVVVFAREAAP